MKESSKPSWLVASFSSNPSYGLESGVGLGTISPPPGIKTPCYEISSRRFLHIALVVFAVAASAHSMSHGTCFNHETTSALSETSILILP